MNKHEWLMRSDPVYATKNTAPMAWACFGQWLEIATTRAGGDISRVDLTTWAKWFGAGLDPQQAATRYECEVKGHEFAYGPHDEDDCPLLTCVHCGEEAQ